MLLCARAALVGVLVAALACSKRSPSAEAPDASAEEVAVGRIAALERSLNLPLAVNGSPLSDLHPDAPWVAVVGDAVMVDDVEVCTTATLGENPQHRQLDVLRQILKERREQWKVEHPHTPFPGETRVFIDEAESVFVVEAVLLSILESGHPNVRLVVKRPDSFGHAELLVGPIYIAYHREPYAVLSLASAEKASLSWQHRNAVLFGGEELETGLSSIWIGSREVVSFPNLAYASATTWYEHGAHSLPSDSSFDKILIEAPEAMPYKLWIAALDALTTPKRKYVRDGKTVTLPAFAAAVAIRGF
jgi:hypothetical protein